MTAMNMIMTTSMTMAMPTDTTSNLTPSSPSAAPSGMSMPGMNMGGSSSCKSSMFWNWYTLDACFLTTKWHINSRAMFAGSCIGVVALVVLLEFLRRLQREYDRRIQRQKMAAHRVTTNATTKHDSNGGSIAHHNNNNSNDPKTSFSIDNPPHSAVPLLENYSRDQSPFAPPLSRSSSSSSLTGRTRHRRHTPTPSQQAIRAVIYTLQFAVAYTIMLLAMYYNGYFLLCILLGAFLGFFIFAWEGYDEIDEGNGASM